MMENNILNLFKDTEKTLQNVADCENPSRTQLLENCLSFELPNLEDAKSLVNCKLTANSVEIIPTTNDTVKDTFDTHLPNDATVQEVVITSSSATEQYQETHLQNQMIEKREQISNTCMSAAVYHPDLNCVSLPSPITIMPNGSTTNLFLVENTPDRLEQVDSTDIDEDTVEKLQYYDGKCYKEFNNCLIKHVKSNKYISTENDTLTLVELTDIQSVYFDRKGFLGVDDGGNAKDKKNQQVVVTTFQTQHDIVKYVTLTDNLAVCLQVYPPIRANSQCLKPQGRVFYLEHYGENIAFRSTEPKDRKVFLAVKESGEIYSKDLTDKPAKHVTNDSEVLFELVDNPHT